MDPKIEQYKWDCVRLCEMLIRDMNTNKEDVNIIFGRELHNAYIIANEKALDKARSILNKINNL